MGQHSKNFNQNSGADAQYDAPIARKTFVKGRDDVSNPSDPIDKLINDIVDGKDTPLRDEDDNFDAYTQLAKNTPNTSVFAVKENTGDGGFTTHQDFIRNKNDIALTTIATQGKAITLCDEFSKAADPEGLNAEPVQAIAPREVNVANYLTQQMNSGAKVEVYRQNGETSYFFTDQNKGVTSMLTVSGDTNKGLAISAEDLKTSGFDSAKLTTAHMPEIAQMSRDLANPAAPAQQMAVAPNVGLQVTAPAV